MVQYLLIQGSQWLCRKELSWKIRINWNLLKITKLRVEIYSFWFQNQCSFHLFWKMEVLPGHPTVNVTISLHVLENCIYKEPFSNCWSNKCYSYLKPKNKKPLHKKELVVFPSGLQHCQDNVLIIHRCRGAFLHKAMVPGICGTGQCFANQSTLRLGLSGSDMAVCVVPGHLSQPWSSGFKNAGPGGPERQAPWVHRSVNEEWLSSHSEKNTRARIQEKDNLINYLHS